MWSAWLGLVHFCIRPADTESSIDDLSALVPFGFEVVLVLPVARATIDGAALSLVTRTRGQ